MRSNQLPKTTRTAIKKKKSFPDKIEGGKTIEIKKKIEDGKKELNWKKAASLFNSIMIPKYRSNSEPSKAWTLEILYFSQDGLEDAHELHKSWPLHPWVRWAPWLYLRECNSLRNPPAMLGESNETALCERKQ